MMFLLEVLYSVDKRGNKPNIVFILNNRCNKIATVDNRYIKISKVSKPEKTEVPHGNQEWRIQTKTALMVTGHRKETNTTKHTKQK